MPAHTNSVASIISASASLVSALAWPALVGILLYGLYTKSDSIGESLGRLVGDNGSAKFGLSPTAGFTLDIRRVAAASANAVINAASKSATGPLDEAQTSQVAKSAQAAAIDLLAAAHDPRKRLKVLWIDDHPENNVDLQFAFQALGIIVICIDSNSAIPQSFDVAQGYDVVITDMFRDMVGANRPENSSGGLQAVEEIREKHPGVPVIIYAGRWSAEHRSDRLIAPIFRVTNYPQEIYEAVVSLAKEKAK